MKKTDFRFHFSLRVRWVEVDMQKIVFNAHYLMYFDTAVGDYWRALCLPYEAAMQSLGGDLFVKKASIEFHASARFDDMLVIGMRCERIGKSSITMVGGIFRGDELLITSELIYVFANPVAQTSLPVPMALRELMLGFEQGQAMTQMQTADWATLSDAIHPLRDEVFVGEQGVAPAIVFDDQDASAVHAVIRNHLGQTLASGRLLREGAAASRTGRIGRMAVTRVMRGEGLGAQVLHALMQASAERGDTLVTLHAQCSAEGFYSRLGYGVRGEPFVEAGIDHIEMVKTL